MATSKSQTLLEWISSGAIYGAVAWIVYAVVECWFSSIQIWIVSSNSEYMPLHWGFTVLLFGLYMVIGLILGGLSGLSLHIAAGRLRFLQKTQPAALFRAAAILSVISAFAVNLFVQKPIGISVLVLLSISLFLIISLILSAGSIIWSRRFGFLTNPWTVCIILLGLSWMTLEQLENHSKIVKAGSSLIYLGVVLLIAFCIQKIIERLWFYRSATVVSISPVKPFTFLLPLVLLVFGISFFLNRETHAVIRNLRTSAPKVDRPNVILITMDTVRADHLSLYGYERDTTPYLKKFSDEATLYTRAIASSDMTLSTHASIFTGLYARKHGAHYDSPDYPYGRALADKFSTLAEILSGKGYITMGVVANHAYLGFTYHLNKGFQYYDMRRGVPFLQSTGKFYFRETIYNILRHFVRQSAFDKVYRSAEEINREVFDLFDRMKEEGRPFFLFINYMDAHWPYIPPPPFDVLFSGKDDIFTTDRYNSIMKEILQLKRTLQEEERLHLLSQYDGGIAYLDFHFGKLVARLKDLGLYENCIIIVTSDHGEAFGERNLFAHGVSVYQDQVYIPLVFKYPNTRQKVVIHEVVSSVDLLPTVLDVLGYEIPEDVQGQSLLRLEPGKYRIVLSESFLKGTLLNWHPRFNRIERAIFSGPYKFISSTAGKRELYDLSKDPDEKGNLYSENGGVSKELEARLDQWVKTVKAETDSTSSPTKLDKEALDRLKALGYVQ